ncbi:integrin alpha-PS1-like [Panonychus citri]|uniref:integrin alpha-PS1-like n=1 Tax=Panonychus citri TaxID=50023 RepID=UPI0023075FF8|nr:integrin alpha-PS1-like [Panonychus citri]
MLLFLFFLLLLLYLLVIPFIVKSCSLSIISSLPWERFTFLSSLTTSVCHANRNNLIVFFFILVNVVLHQQFTIVTSFNFDTRIPFIKEGPVNSYFGYSVAQHLIQKYNSSDYEPIILVGAPRAQTDQPGTNRSGYVFSCKSSSKVDDCVPLEIDFKRSSLAPPTSSEFKNDQWLGVVVKSGGLGGHALTCAHRYVLKGSSDHHWGQGICYSLTNYLDYHRAWEPCFNRPVKAAHEEFGFCQAGTSADISSANDIIIGSPGPYTWRGTVFTNSIKFALRDDKTWYMGPVQESTSVVDKYSYLGMSVTSGKFFGNNLSYVGGAPRSNGTGQVIFYSKRKSTLFAVELILNGEQFASSFGYTILAMDLQNDNKSDLIVGAPFYYDGSRSTEGAVYIYYNTGKGIQSKYDVRLFGKQDSRFGWSLADLGDINKDGFNDLAIGAPYDEGGGSVYIYLGSPNGIKTNAVQVIRGDDISAFPKIGRNIKTFGYSLSGSADMDKNGYPDLLVGAYESDATILLRARPILNIATRVENITQIDPNREGCIGDPTSKLPCFDVEPCFLLMPSGRSTSKIVLRYIIEAESFLDKKPIVPRVKFNSSAELDSPHIVNKTTIISGDRLGRWNCLKELVYIKDKSDIHRSIQFQLTYSLEQDEPRGIVTSYSSSSDIDKYPILNQEEARKVFQASFLKECRNTEQCQSNLNVIAKLLHPLDTPGYEDRILYLGSTDVNLELTVRNTMEPAYDANIYIYHPYITYIGKDQVEGEQIDCKPFNISLLVCSLGNPFKRGEVKLNLKFDPKEISDVQNDIDLRVFVNTSSVDLSQSKNDVTTKLLIIRRADLEIKGSSDPAGVWFGGDPVGEAAMKTSDDIGSRIEHSYTIISAGPYHPKELTVEVDWPYSLSSDHEEGKWLLYLMSTIVVQGKGQCVPTFGAVNPLKIRDTESSPIKSDSFTKSRPKRQTIVPAKRIMEDGKSQNVVSLDCQKKTARCYKFLCYLQDLRPGVPSVIVFIGRLWNSTFVEDYASGVNQVHIYSRAKLTIGPSIRQNRTNDDATFVITKAYPDVPLLPPARVPLWIIIMSILLGILLLILLIIVLWRCGFFKRRLGYMTAPVEDKDFDEYN